MSDQDVELPGTKLKVIGLISGGKDSCFNLVHCIANGHELVALATLQPADGIEELDSHIYQSVGTRIAPLIADAMGLPLYTGVIKGKALEQGPEYGDRVKGGAGSGVEGDETEDLTVLLEQVMVSSVFVRDEAQYSRLHTRKLQPYLLEPYSQTTSDSV